MTTKARMCRWCGGIFRYNDMMATPPDYCSVSCAHKEELGAIEARLSAALAGAGTATWTKEVPKVDGWYWVCEWPMELPYIVNVFFGKMSTVGCADMTDMSEYAMFLGPIEVPQPPEVE